MLSCNRLQRGWPRTSLVDPRRARGSTPLRSVNRRVFPPSLNYCFPIHQSRTNLVEMHRSRKAGRGAVGPEKNCRYFCLLSSFSVCASRRQKLCKLYSGAEETSLIIYPRIMSFREIRAPRGRGWNSSSDGQPNDRCAQTDLINDTSN